MISIIQTNNDKTRKVNMCFMNNRIPFYQGIGNNTRLHNINMVNFENRIIYETHFLMLYVNYSIFHAIDEANANK